MQAIQKIQTKQKIVKTQKIKKMNNLIFLSTCLLGLTGCANMQPQSVQTQTNLTPARQIISQPVVMPTQPSKADYQLAYGNNPALASAYQKYIATGRAPNIVTDGFEIFAYGNSQPVVATSPLELTVITLQEGENVTNVSSGDPLRWSYSLAYSGAGKTKQANVMVKPSQSDISTDLVITTDKRMYTLKLVSSLTGKYHKNIKFWYPDDIQAFWDNYNAQQAQSQSQPDTVANVPNININQMNFDYSISAPFFSPPVWKPVRVFDDGTHTYIQFSSAMNSQDMPALFVQNGTNEELVNYRSKPPYFVVDKIFKQAVLVTGVGNQATKVTITNNQSS